MEFLEKTRDGSLLVCWRCGIDYQLSRKYVGKVPNWDMCASCKAKPAKQSGKKDCTPHLGELDEFLRPIDKNGELYKPGERSCGNSDCVKNAHIFKGGSVCRRISCNQPAVVFDQLCHKHHKALFVGVQRLGY